ncbi:hypothetical protein ACWECC_01330 [Streptomyces microflavus]
MASIKGRFEYPDDLTPGHSKDGGLHHNLYNGQKNLVGHAKFIPDDENEEDAATEPSPVFLNTNKYDCESDSQAQRLGPEEIVEAMIILIKFAEWTAPRLKKLWNDQALPFIKSTHNRFTQTRKADSPDTPSESATLFESTSPDSSQEAIAKLEEDRVSMSSEEASARFSAALMARIFSDEQVRILRSARIEDEGDSLELRTLEKPTRQQIAENARLMLEENPSLLTRESLAELGKILAIIQSRPNK